jgi:membrane protease YdiL (CAAX protease family)
VAILIVYLLVRAYWSLYERAGAGLDPLWAQTLTQVVLWALPCLLMVMVWRRVSFTDAWHELGLGRGIGAGVVFGLLTTAPMAVAAVLADGARLPSAQRAVSDSLLGPFAESVLFTGFLFTQLVHRARWPVVAGIIACGLTFGLAHIHNVEGGLVRLLLTGNPDVLIQDIGLFAPGVLAVGAGGAIFTWIFHRSRSLWLPMALHALMNFWWAVSGEGMSQATATRPIVTPTAVGQMLSMALAIGVTLYASRLADRYRGKRTWTAAVRSDSN